MKNTRTRRNVMSKTIAMSPIPAPSKADQATSIARKLVPLSSLAKLTYGVGPLAISHLGQLPSVTMSFDLRPGISLSEAITQVDKAMQDLQVPATLNATFQGTAQAFQASL